MTETERIAHPNKRHFIGILPCVEIPSAKSPLGARGHKILLTREAVENAISSFVGMGINIHAEGTDHNAPAKVGMIETAEVTGNDIVLTGYLFSRDVPDVIARLEASYDWGMSYESANSHVEDMRAPVYRVTACTFTGAAILKRDKAAYTMTDFILI